MRDFYIIDTTLRDGEQTAGVSFTLKQRLKIARMLDSAGVDMIEAGIPAMGEAEMSFIKELLGLHLKAPVLTWNRLCRADVDLSIQCGVRHLHISAPVSDLHILRKLGKARQWILQQLELIVTECVESGCIVSVGAEDASRADEAFLITYYQTAKRAGAARVRYADTVGVLTPLQTFQRIQRVRDAVDIEIDFHGHNDFGMATANAMTAFEAGARYISCSVNGLGERAGNTPLEELVMALKEIHGARTGFHIQNIMALSQVVEAASKRRIHESKPIVGSAVFSHESGIHVHGLLKDSRTYEAFPPECIGRRRSIVLGKYSGTAAIVHKYAQNGIEISREKAGEVLHSLRKETGY